MSQRKRFQDRLLFLGMLAGLGGIAIISVGLATNSGVLMSGLTLGAIGWSIAIRRPLHLFCTFCGKCILSDTNWTCGFCSHRNDWRTWYYSFLNKCAKCKMPPAIYACHYCDTPIALMDNVNLDSPREVLHTAYHLNPPELPGGDVSREAEREEAIAEAEFEIKLTKLMKERADAIRELRCAEERNQPKTPAVAKPKRAQLEEDLARERDEMMAVEEVADQARKVVEKECGGDQDLLERHRTVIENWRQKHIQ